MTYNEVMDELKEMRSHYDSGFSSLEKQRIMELYWRILRKKIKNIACGDCYRDAFLEIFTFLKREGKLPEEKHYELQDGKYLHIFGSSEYLFDVTDEQAETFLGQFPQAISDFKTYPEDWEDRVRKRKNRVAQKKCQAAKKAAEKALKEKITEDNEEE